MQRMMAGQETLEQRYHNISEGRLLRHVGMLIYHIMIHALLRETLMAWECRCWVAGSPNMAFISNLAAFSPWMDGM